MGCYFVSNKCVDILTVFISNAYRVFKMRVMTERVGL